MPSTLERIEDLAHHAANGGHKRPGKGERVSDLKGTLRTIRDLARTALAQGEEVA